VAKYDYRRDLLPGMSVTGSNRQLHQTERFPLVIVRNSPRSNAPQPNELVHGRRDVSARQRIPANLEVVILFDYTYQRAITEHGYGGILMVSSKPIQFLICILAASVLWGPVYAGEMAINDDAETG
jgi:hypothetical protein